MQHTDHTYGQFDCILTDPAWFYAARLRGEGRTKFGEGATGHYDCMTDAELLETAPLIEALAAPRCAMFMWVTGPRLDFAIEYGKACGFEYSTIAFTWVKISKDGEPRQLPGTYTASNVELCLLFTREEKSFMRKLTPANAGGKRMVPQVVEEFFAANPQVIRHPLMEHSRKPDEVHARIDAMYPGLRKIELFARRQYPGWSAVGNELDGLDIRDALVLAAGGFYDLEVVEELVG